MSKIKSVSTYDGSSWGTAVPLGADDVNVDITSATTNPTDSTNTVASLSTADVTVASGDDNATAWTKFNRFRKRVANNFGRYIAGSIQTSYSATGSNTVVYPTSVINNYMQNVIGLTGTSTPTINGSAQTVASALSSLNNNIIRPNLLDNWYFVRGSGSVGAYGSFPVNQRGQASYSAAGFTIDRLNKASSKGTVYSTAQGLQFSTSDNEYAYFNFFGQDVPSWMTATYSILTNLGITTVRTGGNAATLPSGILVYIDSNRRLSLRIPGNLSQSNSETFIAAKVEIGSTQTLAHQENGAWVLNEIPDYSNELDKCKYYFERLEEDYLCLGTGFAESATKASIVGRIHPKNKVVTAASIKLNGSIHVWRPGTAAASAFAASSIDNGSRVSTDGAMYLNVPVTGFTQGVPVYMQLRPGDGYIDISTE